jgi:hypothetical protein
VIPFHSVTACGPSYNLHWDRSVKIKVFGQEKEKNEIAKTFLFYLHVSNHWQHGSVFRYADKVARRNGQHPPVA